jgi:hypothetical protein
VAGPYYFDTGQLSHFITYLFLIYLPMFIIFICCSAIPENLASHRFLMATILWGTPWPPQGHRGPIFQRHRKVKMKVRNRHCQATMREKLRVHLFALTIASFKAGCCVELSLETSVTRIMLGLLQFKAPMAIHGTTKSISTLTLFQSELTTMHCTAMSTLPTCLMILFSRTRAQLMG